MEDTFFSQTKMPRWYLDGTSLFARYKEQRNKQQIILDYYPKIILTEVQCNNFKGLAPADKRSKTVIKGQTRDKDIDARMIKILNAIIEVLKRNDPFRLTKKTFSQLVDKELNKKIGKYQSGILKYLEDQKVEEGHKNYEDQKKLRYIISLLEKFNKSLTFEQVNHKVLDEFVEYLQNHPREYSKNYITQLINELMSWIIAARNEGVHRNDAYLGWTRPQVDDVYNIFLTEEEIERIYNLEFILSGDVFSDYWKYCGFDIQAYENFNRCCWSHVKSEEELRSFIGDNLVLQGHLKRAIKLRLKHLEECKYLFVLGCWTGLRSANYLQINEKTLLSEDLKRLDVKTVKGGRIIPIPLHPLAREVFERAKHVAEMVRKTNSQFNLVLPVLGKLAEINEPIMFNRNRGGKLKETTLPKYMLIRSHTARRSLCSNLLIRGFSESAIMAISGHKDRKSFLRYISAVTEIDRLKEVYDHPMYAYNY